MVSRTEAQKLLQTGARPTTGNKIKIMCENPSSDTHGDLVGGMGGHLGFVQNPLKPCIIAIRWIVPRCRGTSGAGIRRSQI